MNIKKKKTQSPEIIKVDGLLFLYFIDIPCFQKYNFITGIKHILFMGHLD